MPSIFDGYPYSNTHQLNLDWIIAEINKVQPALAELKTILENLEDINDVVEEAKNASVKASAAAESAEEATEKINSATVNNIPVVNNPVLTAAKVGAVADSATVNGVPVVNNPVLDAEDVGAVPDSATVNGVPVVNNPILKAANVGALAKENIRNAFTNIDANGNPSVNAPSTYPTKPGVYRTVSDLGALPSGANPYGTLIIFNGGSYVKHIYIDGSKKIFVADTNGSEVDVEAPTPEAWVQVLTENNFPGMVPNVEYLTIEKHNGKAVYTKLVQFGSLPNNTEKSVEAFPANANMIEAIGYAVGDSYNIPIPGYQSIQSVGSTRSSGRVWISTTTDMTSYTAWITIKYTKD